MVDRRISRAGVVRKLTLAEKVELAAKYNHGRSPSQRRTEADIHNFVSTVEYAAAGRVPTYPGKEHPPSPESEAFERYARSMEDIREEWSLSEHLFRTHQKTYIRRQGFEDPADSESVCHYVLQKGEPSAFIYAVELGTGIKVGKSGTGDGDLLVQVSGRFGSYRSTHKVDVVGLAECGLLFADRAEAELLSLLAKYKLPFGEEMFEACPKVKAILWDWFHASWHRPVPAKDLEKWRLDDGYGGGHDLNEFLDGSTFHEIQGEKVQHLFSWQDYVRLHEEISLLATVQDSDLWQAAEDLAGEIRRRFDGPPFGESEGDDATYEIMEVFLPSEESLYPQARHRMHAAMGWPKIVRKKARDELELRASEFRYG